MASTHQPGQVERVEVASASTATVVLVLATKPGGFRAAGKVPGVAVSVDGEDKGALPLTYNQLTPGKHTLRFCGGEAYQCLEKVLTVTAGQVEDLGNVELRQAPSILQVVCEPACKEVTCEHKKLEGFATGAEIEPGEHTCIASAPGMQSTMKVQLKPGQRITQKVTLTSNAGNFDWKDLL